MVDRVKLNEVVGILVRRGVPINPVQYVYFPNGYEGYPRIYLLIDGDDVDIMVIGERYDYRYGVIAENDKSYEYCYIRDKVENRYLKSGDNCDAVLSFIYGFLNG